ncbi:MAG: hypothetical protein ACAI25_05655 [Planctomycetota bacterium]
MPRVAVEVELSTNERRQLSQWAKMGPRALAVRSKIILLASQGLRNDQIVARLRGTKHAATRNTVSTWRQNFARLGLRAFGRQASKPDNFVKRGARRSVKKRSAARAHTG